MTDLVQRLKEAIGETERIAQAATPGPWRVDSEAYAEAIYGGPDGCTDVVSGGRWGGEASVFDQTADAVHIVAQNPERVLARCAAERKVLDLCDLVEELEQLVDYDRGGVRRLGGEAA